LTTNIFSQQIPLNLSEFPFIDLSKNKLEIYNSSIYFERFYNKLDTFLIENKGKINILHIGASHVQGGFLTNQIRRNFDLLNGDNKTSRGFIFPYKVAKTNNPKNFEVCFTGEWTSERNVGRSCSMPLGLAGIAVSTSDSAASISIKLNTDSVERRRTFTKLVLIGQTDEPQTVIPVIYTNGKEFLPCFFDAKTNAYIYELHEYADTFKLAFMRSDSSKQSFTVYGFIPENDTQGIVYHEVGVNGATVSSYLNCENFERELALIKPDMVIFGIGINDWVGNNMTEREFIANYMQLIERIRGVSPDCALVFITNNDSFKKIRLRRRRTSYAVNTNGLHAQNAFRELARQNNGALWDQFAIMGGLRSMKQWERAGLAAKDKIHFTKKGYEILGNLLFEAMIEQQLTISN
jgi:lysophospholipase L1-like esterase